MCPASHPIPCRSGAMCTNMMFSINPTNCNETAMAQGVCCPEDAVPCKADNSKYLCRANPEYGIPHSEVQDKYFFPIYSDFSNIKANYVRLLIPYPVPEAQSVQRGLSPWIRVTVRGATCSRVPAAPMMPFHASTLNRATSARETPSLVGFFLIL